MKFWIILIVLFNIKLSIAYVYCDRRAILRRRTYAEMILCQSNFYSNEDYSDHNDSYFSRNRNHGYICNSSITDYSKKAICTASSLASNDSLNIEGPKLRIIEFKNSSITTVPPQFFKDHPSLQAIYMENCYINDIDINAFEDIERLEELFLGSNNITEIKKGIFDSLKYLKILDISNNQISTIDKTSFNAYVHLQLLNVSHNKIQNISELVLSLDSLDISHNNIISPMNLQTITNLFNSNGRLINFSSYKLNLSFNKLKSFNFSELVIDLEELNLGNNNLDTLNGLIDNSLENKIIYTLSLNNNRLSKFNYVPRNIRTLDLSDNILHDLEISGSTDFIRVLVINQNFIGKLLPNAFDNMLNLTKLYIENNKLTSLPIGIFNKLKNLEVLNLSGNQLKQIEFGTFSGLSKVMELDISRNLFTNLDYKAFYVFRKLFLLNIENNKLTTLNPYDIINHCKDLRQIMLGGNPWNCESLLNFTMVFESNHIKVMEGSHNNIQNHLGHACYDYDAITESQKYDDSLHNLTDTLNLLNLKFSNITQTNLMNPILLNSSQVNLENYEQGLSNFSNLNVFNKSTVDLLLTNLEEFSKSADDISSSFDKESSLHELFQDSIDSDSQMSSFYDRNQGMAQQIASLRSNFIAFMSILITILLIAMLFPVIKKFANVLTRKSNTCGTNKSTTNLPLI